MDHYGHPGVITTQELERIDAIFRSECVLHPLYIQNEQVEVFVDDGFLFPINALFVCDGESTKRQLFKVSITTIVDN